MPLLARIATMLMSVLGTFISTYGGRLLAALGISVISYKGISSLQSQFVNYLTSQFSNMPSEVLQIFYLAGGGVALNYIFGASAFAFGLMSVTKIGSVFKR